MAITEAFMDIIRSAPSLGESTRQLQAFAEANSLSAEDIYAVVEQAKGYGSGTADRDRRESFLNDQRVADKSISGLGRGLTAQPDEVLDRDEAVLAIMRNRNS